VSEGSVQAAEVGSEARVSQEWQQLADQGAEGGEAPVELAQEAAHGGSPVLGLLQAGAKGEYRHRTLHCTLTAHKIQKCLLPNPWNPHACVTVL